MVAWGEKMRQQNPAYFFACIDLTSVHFIVDCRRKSDIQFFKSVGTAVATVRICSDEAAREKRGWQFTPGIDDAETECDLDDFEFDFKIHNNIGTSDADLIYKFSDILKQTHSV